MLQVNDLLFAGFISQQYYGTAFSHAVNSHVFNRQYSDNF